MPEKPSPHIETAKVSPRSTGLSSEATKYYSMPDLVTFHGVPEGANWSYPSSEANNLVLIDEAWSRAHQYNPAAFPQPMPKWWWHESFKLGCRYRDNKLMLHGYGYERSAAECNGGMSMIDNLWKTDPRNGIFIGRLTEVGPVETEMDPTEGPATMEITTGFSRTRSWSTTRGWSAGGEIGISAGQAKTGSLAGNFSYSKSTTEGEDYSESSQKSFSVPVASGESRWLVGRRAGGYYAGWFLYRYAFADDGSGGWRITTWDAFPVSRVFVKPPAHKFAATWHQRSFKLGALNPEAEKLYQSYKNSHYAAPEKGTAWQNFLREAEPHVKEEPAIEVPAK
ncbi:hypothetical protein [Streptomyces smyrnaeus]|uniref:hypothetical protein n=1 Tax=Streptomyces smyrnaeus TaxID=1387713 RepID=UPI000C4C089D